MKTDCNDSMGQTAELELYDGNPKRNLVLGTLFKCPRVQGRINRTVLTGLKHIFLNV